jgi:hypothetical protein
MPSPRTIQEVCRHGRVELAETPDGVDEARVLVVFLESDAASQGNGHPAPPTPVHAKALPPAAAVPAIPVVQQVPEAPVSALTAVSPENDASSTGAILDCISPRQPKGRVRLPARSRRTLSHHSGSVTLIERLTGKVEAIAALILGLFVLVCVEWMATTQFRNLREGSIVLWILWLAEAILIPLVINSTWCRTTLTASADKPTCDSHLLLLQRNTLGGRTW